MESPSNESRGPSWLDDCGDTRERDRRNYRRVVTLALAYFLCIAAVRLTVRTGLVASGPPGWALGLVPAAVAVFVFMAYARFLREADELQRLIHLSALAAGFGGGFFGSVGLQLLERTGAVLPRFVDVSAIMMVFYLVGFLVARRRYV